MAEPVKLYLDEDTISRALMMKLLDAKSTADMQDSLEFLGNWR